MNLCRKNGHTVVGVFTIPDKNGREVITIWRVNVNDGIVEDPCMLRMLSWDRKSCFENS